MSSESNSRSPWVLIIALTLASPATPCLADDVYKYVNKDGEVVYSQVPPRQEQLQNEDSLIRHTLNQKSATPALRITRKEGYDYCGQLRLPGPVNERATVLEGVRRDLPAWEHALADHQNKLDVYLARFARHRASGQRLDAHAESPGESHSNLVRKVNEFRCAVDWGRGKQVELAETGPNIAKEFARTRADYEKLLGKAYQDCGAEPSGDHSTPDFKASEYEWHTCMRKYQSELKATKRDLDRLQGLAQ